MIRLEQKCRFCQQMLAKVLFGCPCHWATAPSLAHLPLFGNPSFAGNSSSCAPHLARVTQANIFSRMTERLKTVCVISKKSHPHWRISCRTLHAHGLTAFLLLCRTALRLHSTSKQEYPLSPATRISVWPFCRTEPAHIFGQASLFGYLPLLFGFARSFFFTTGLWRSFSIRYFLQGVKSSFW